MQRLRTAAMALAVASISLVGCGGQDQSNLPNGADLLSQSAESTGKINTAHFVISVEGENIPEALTVRSIDGDINKAGDAAGFIHLAYSGTTFEGDFVIVGGKGYYKGVTGGWQERSAAAMKLLYDSSVILDANRGIAKMLELTKNAETVSREKIGDVEAYKISGDTPQAIVTSIVPGFEEDPVHVDYWVEAAAPHRMMRAEMKLQGDGRVTADLTNPDKPIEIKAPI